jgi:hypothetical protein
MAFMSPSAASWLNRSTDSSARCPLRALQFGGQRPCSPQSLAWVGVVEGAGQAGVEAAAVGFGQVVGEVAFLVKLGGKRHIISFQLQCSVQRCQRHPSTCAIAGFKPT